MFSLGAFEIIVIIVIASVFVIGIGGIVAAVLIGIAGLPSRKY